MSNASQSELDYQELRLYQEQWADRCQYLLGLARLTDNVSEELINTAKNIADNKQERAKLDLSFAAYLDSLQKVAHLQRKWEGVRFAQLNLRLDLIETSLEKLLQTC